MNKSILILAKFDSFARVAKQLADCFATHGYHVDFRLIQIGSEALAPRLYQELNLPRNTPVTTINSLFQSSKLSEFAAVYLGATGGFIFDFLKRLKTAFPAGKQRPITISGYPGIILREKLTGFSNRCGCDYILLNSAADLRDYRAFCSNYSLDDSGALNFGYAFPAFQKPKVDKIKNVLFAEQAVIPVSYRDRSYLVEKLVAYSATFPEQEVIIKPRLIPGEKSVFITKYHLEDIIKSLPATPANLRIDYRDIQMLLENSDLCLTLSSTVALQAMWYGIPTGIIRDFGIRDEYGTDFFRESGCLVTFADLLSGRMPQLHAPWFLDNFTSYNNTVDLFINNLEEKYNTLKRQRGWNYHNLDLMFPESYQQFKAKRKNRKSFYAKLSGWVARGYKFMKHNLQGKKSL